MSTDIVTYGQQALSDRMEYARTIATAADLVPSALHDKIMKQLDNGAWVQDGNRTQVNPGKVLLVMEYGAMLGLHPIAALSGIYVIEGKPSASAGTLQAVIREAGHRLRVTTKGSWDDGTFEAIAELTRSDDPDFTFRAVWTKKRAERAGLLGKDNWKKYPEGVAKARAISEVCREGGEDAMHGVHYTPEELGANVTESGDVVVDAEVVEHTPVEKPKPARRKPTNGAQGTKRKPAEEPEEPEESERTGPLEAGVPIDGGPMDGLVPTAEQVAGAEASRAAREHIEQARANGVDVSVADDIIAAEVPSDDDAPEPDEGPAAALDGTVDEGTGEVTYAEPAPTDEPTESEWAEWIGAAQSVAQLKAVWDDMNARGASTSILKAATAARRRELEAAQA